MADQDLEHTRAFLSDLEVAGTMSPPRDDEFLSDDDTMALPEVLGGDGAGADAVVIGSQIAEFAKDMPAEVRPMVANSFLLAQLAANRSTAESNGGTMEWYQRYTEVLKSVGWIVEGDVTMNEEVKADSGTVHSKILPLLALTLGPGAAGAAVVIAKVLESLDEMDDGPWITIFDRESKRASAHQFQLSYADAPDGVHPRISLACFELDAEQRVTRVLFFRFANATATLRHSGMQLSADGTVFEQVQDLVEKKVAEYVSANIAAIEI